MAITQVDQSLVLEERLRKAEVDLVVMQVFTDEIERDDIVLREDRLCWVKSLDYQIPCEGPIPFIAFDQICFYRKWATNKFLESGTKLEVILECASNEGVCSAISSGMGIALIGERLVKSAMEKISFSFAKPPNIAFIVRTATIEPSIQLIALRDEINRTLAK